MNELPNIEHDGKTLNLSEFPDEIKGMFYLVQEAEADVNRQTLLAQKARLWATHCAQQFIAAAKEHMETVEVTVEVPDAAGSE